MATIELKDGESLDFALRRFKRIIQRENVLRDLKSHSHFLRPGEKKRIKHSMALRRRVRRVFGGPNPYSDRVTKRVVPASIAAEEQAVSATQPEATETQNKQSEKISETATK